MRRTSSLVPLTLLLLVESLLLGFSMAAKAQLTTNALFAGNSFGQTNQIWRYEQVADPTGTGWEQPGYNDSAWPSGQALLAFESGAWVLPFRNTILLDPRLADNPPQGHARYFRTHFTWTGNPAGGTLVFNVRCDDGAVIYLNGVEVYRLRPPPDPITHASVGAPLACGGDADCGDDVFTVASPALVAGDNVLAVAVYQNATGSSDLVWGTGLAGIPGVAPSITNPAEPHDMIVTANRMTNLSVFAIGSPTPSYQWYKDGGPIDPGVNATATTSVYVIPNMTAGDAGSYFCRVANVLGSVDSRTATVGFNNDTNAPVLVEATGTASFDRIILQFNELVESNSVVDPFNYDISDGANTLNISGVALNANGSSVTLMTDLQTPDTLYTITVNGVSDLANNIIAMDSTILFRSWVLSGCGGVLFEAYNTGGGNAVSDLTNHPDYPNHPRDVMRVAGFTSRLAYPDDSHEGYGARMRGVFIPPESGNWRLYLWADDGSQLWFNPSGPESAGRQLLLDRTACCGDFSSANSRTAPLPLLAGRPYYLEILYKEGTGGDYGQAAARLDGQPTPPTTEYIPGDQLGATAAPAGIVGPVNITSQPADVSTNANTLVSFSVNAQNPSDILCFQWQRSDDGGGTFNDVAGATLRTFGFGPVSVADNGARFRCKVGTIGASATSREALLNVRSDTNAPSCISATASLTLSNIVIQFSEFMETNSAQDRLNYDVPGFGVTSATLNPDGKSVTLTLDAPLSIGSSYQVTIQGLTDLAGNPINPNPCTLTFRTPVVSCGFLVFQAYRPESTSDNSLDNTLLADPNFPSRPNEVLYMSAFDTRTVYPNDSHEGYGALMFGYFIPPTSGNWIFYLRSDDSSRLYLNPTGSDPAGKVLIQEETACCGPFSAHASAPQALTAGQQYYIEALLKEGTGGDYCQVAAKLDTDPRNPDSLSPISGAYLAALADPAGASVAITQQPVDATFVASSDTLANESFNSGDGAFTVQTPQPMEGPWVYDAPSGSWHTDGQHPENNHPNTTILTGPTYAITKSGVVTLRLVHKYSFEFDGTRWDGGQVRISVNGSPFTAIPAAAFTQNGYGGNTVFVNSRSELAGQPAFTASSPGYIAGLTSGGFITSIASGSFNAGDTIRIQFYAAADTNTRNVLDETPCWQIDSVQLTQGGGAAQTVTFSAAVNASGTPIFYQWYRDNGSGYVAIAGANGASYTFPPECSDNGARFRVAVYIPGATVTSAAATLTVTAPNTAPRFALTPPPAGSANSGPVSVPNVAHDIAPGSAVTSVAIPSIGLNFGAEEAAGNNAGTLGASEKAGAVAQANWNNLTGASGSGSGAVADYSGAAVSTLVSVTWASPNTWSTTGRGEENNGFAAGSPDRKLMTGYLDTGDTAANGLTVTVSGLGSEFTSGGYDVLVYSLGGVSGRGGAYTIGGTTKYGTSPANPAAQVEDAGAGLVDSGTYVRFNGLSGSAFTLTANADATVNPAGTVNFRAPVNAIQIVAHQPAPIPVASYCTAFDALPAGSVSSGTTPPFVDAGHLVLSRNGVGNEANYWTLPLGQLPVAQSFKATWRSLLNGVGGADGYSFNLGQNVGTGFTPEEGGSSGLTVAVDTFDNGGGEVGIETRWNGNRLSFLAIGGGTVNGPAALEKNQFVDATVEVSASGQVTFNYDGFITVGQIPNYSGISGNQLVLAARTGGASEDVFIDNLCLAGFAPGGCGDESGQTVQFLVSNNNPGLFTTQPAISPNGTLTYTPAPGGCGMATVTVVAMDNGGTAFGGRDTSDPRTFILSIINCPPTITCPPGVTAECTGALTPVTYTVTAVDSSGAPVPVTCVPPSGTGFRLGVSNVVCTATAGGLSSSCTFQVTVVDTTPPQVNCPGNMTAQATSPAGAVVTYIAAASDACGIASFACTPPSGSTFPCGNTTVTCRAVDNAGLANSCSFTITVTCETNRCPTAVAKASPNVQLTADQTNTIVISANNSNACVTLDGSMSTDPDGDALTYVWLADLDGDGVKEPIASGVIATACLELGEHVIMLMVDDGRCAATASITVEVLTVSEAIEVLIDKINDADLGRRNKRPLIASLKAAMASFDRGSCVSGVNQLQAFQHKVRAQIGREDSALADEIIALAQKILDAIECEPNGTP